MTVSEALAGALARILGGWSALALALTFLGGVLTSIGPCNIAMIPVIIGYVGGQQEVTRSRGFWLSLFFTLGSSVTFVLLGVLAAAVGALFGTETAILKWLAAVVCLVIGLNLLGVLKLNLDFLTRLQPKRVVMTGSLGAFVLGLIMGLAGSQCATPVLAAIVTLALEKGDLVFGGVLLFAYALGRGVPVVVAGTFTGVLKALPALEKATSWMQKAAGVVLIGVGVYFIWIA